MRYLALYDTQDGQDSHRAKRAIREFLDRGESEVHSARGLVLHSILNHCVAAGIGFELTFIPGSPRYVVRRLP